MSEPTARELLDDLVGPGQDWSNYSPTVLAGRVEAVLALVDKWKDHPGTTRWLAQEVERLLNGGKP